MREYKLITPILLAFLLFLIINVELFKAFIEILLLLSYFNKGIFKVTHVDR